MSDETNQGWIICFTFHLFFKLIVSKRLRSALLCAVTCHTLGQCPWVFRPHGPTVVSSWLYSVVTWFKTSAEQGVCCWLLDAFDFSKTWHPRIHIWSNHHLFWAFPEVESCKLRSIALDLNRNGQLFKINPLNTSRNSFIGKIREVI